jgi:DNA-binding GntR family transcriptional regulator
LRTQKSGRLRRRSKRALAGSPCFTPLTLIPLTSFSEEMHSRKIKPSFRLIKIERCVSPVKVARILNLAADQSAYYIERVLLGNGEPIALTKG